MSDTVNKRKKYIFWILWAVVGMALLWRTQYCVAGEEESYFLQEANAYLRGQIPILEMWGGTFFSSMIFMPLAGLYHAVKSSWDGVYLFLRICYVLFTCAVSATMYTVLKRFTGRFWAGIAALLGLIFTPLNLNTFSYNSMGMHFTMLFVLLALLGAAEHRWHAGVLSGAFFALALQAYPPMIVLTPVCFVLLMIYPKQHRLAAFGQFCAGGAVVFAVFVGELMARTSLGEYISHLDYIFLKDSVHQGHGGLLSTIINWLASCRWWYGTTIILVCGVLWVICGAVRLAECRGKQINPRVWTVLRVLVFLAAVWGLVMLPRGEKFYSNMKWFIPGLLWPAVLFCAWPKNKKTGLVLCITGLLYAVGIFYGTDLGIVNASYGFYFCVIGELVWLGRALKESQWTKSSVTKRAVLACVGILVLLLPMQLAYMRFFYDSFGNPTRCSVTIDRGIMTGLKVEPEKADVYYGVVRDVTENVPQGAKLLVLDILPYAYMLGDYTICAPSPWINDVGDNQIKLYYEKNPHLMPDYVFVADEKTGFANRADTSAESLPEGRVKELLMQPGVTSVKTESGTFYTLPNG